MCLSGFDKTFIGNVFNQRKTYKVEYTGGCAEANNSDMKVVEENLSNDQRLWISKCFLWVSINKKYLYGIVEVIRTNNICNLEKKKV